MIWSLLLLLIGSLQAKPAEDDVDLWIGQMLMVGFRGTELAPGDPFFSDIRELKLGGVVLFDYDVALKAPVRNIESRQQVLKLTRSLQTTAPLPLLIAIDQEGGRVARLKPQHGFPELPSQEELGRLDQERITRKHARETAELLADLGINVNFAPVLDLFYPDNPIIGKMGRSYGADPSDVIRHAHWTIEEFHRGGILSAVKHFPGHGSSRQDSHLGLPDVTSVWSSTELKPFADLIREGLPDMVMTAHLFNRTWDPENPATLSRPVITGMLRQSLGFQGVVVSDDMQMGAIRHTLGFKEAIRRAVDAGVDILLFGNNLNYQPDVARKAEAALRALVREGKIRPQRLQDSYQRIHRLKQKLTRSSDLVHISGMKKMVISEFKVKCIAVLREAQRTGEPVVITRRGRPVARIEPILEGAAKRSLGALRGRMKIKADILRADTVEDWEMLK